MSEEKTPLEMSLDEHQREYNFVCAQIGHARAQILKLEGELSDFEARAQGIMKKANSLVANQPKKEESK